MINYFASPWPNFLEPFLALVKDGCPGCWPSLSVVNLLPCRMIQSSTLFGRYFARQFVQEKNVSGILGIGNAPVICTTTG